MKNLKQSTNDISFEKGVVFGVLTIDTLQEKFKVGLDSGSATAINSAIHEVLDNLKISNKNDHTSVPVPISNAEEIIKYKELQDAGIITPEEFEAKKKQLLGL